MLIKILDIRTRRKRFTTRTAKNYAPNLRVILQLPQNPSQALPHLIRDSIPLIWAIERDPRNRIGAVYKYLFVHVFAPNYL